MSTSKTLAASLSAGLLIALVLLAFFPKAIVCAPFYSPNPVAFFYCLKTK